MSVIPIRIGVPSISLSVDTLLGVGSASALVFSACALTPTDVLVNDVNQPLLATDTYQVIVGMVGRDGTNKGYTVGQTSISSGDLSVTAGQVIEVKVANAAWSTVYGFNKAICAAIFLKINAADFQLVKFAYIPDTDDFTTVIMAKPLRVAPKFASSLLTATTADPILGDRVPLGITYAEITPTTGAFDVKRPVATVTVSPNTSPDFPMVTSRGVSVAFQSLINDIKEFVRAAAGLYAKYNSGGLVIENAQMSLVTAFAFLRGNRALKIVMPPDQFGAQETRILIGTLAVNNTEINENWSKSGTTPCSFVFDAAPMDSLITNQHSEIIFNSH